MTTFVSRLVYKHRLEMLTSPCDIGWQELMTSCTSCSLVTVTNVPSSSLYCMRLCEASLRPDKMFPLSLLQFQKGFLNSVLLMFAPKQ